VTSKEFPKAAVPAGPVTRPWAWALVLGALIWCCACVSTGRPAITEPAAVARIETGKTTKDEVSALLGLPVAVYFPKDGEEEWNYPYLTEFPQTADFLPLANAYTGLNYQTRTLTVVFAGDGRVKRLEAGERCGGVESVPKYF